MVEKIIVIQDGGSDTLAMLAVFLAYPERFEVAGVVSTFGNVGHDQVVENNGRILAFLNATRIPYFRGVRGPTGNPVPEGDGAHGSNGLGGVELPPTPVMPREEHGIDFILETLRTEPEHTVTVMSPVPQTTLAQALVKDRATMERVKRIVIMGGCTDRIPAKDMPFRRGNITPYAEFNIQQAPQDAKTVFDSGLPITLFPMNCTQVLSLTPQREADIRKALNGHRARTETIIKILRAPLELDRMKFGSDPFLHDVNAALGVLNPGLYEGRQGLIMVTTEGRQSGQTDFEQSITGNVYVAERLKDPDAAFGYLLEALQKCIASSPNSRAEIVLGLTMI